MEKVICPKCKRILPSSEFLTEEGCVWCDEKNARRKDK